jgi:hypothetical protein
MMIKKAQGLKISTAVFTLLIIFTINIGIALPISVKAQVGSAQLVDISSFQKFSQADILQILVILKQLLGIYKQRLALMNAETSATKNSDSSSRSDSNITTTPLTAQSEATVGIALDQTVGDPKPTNQTVVLVDMTEELKPENQSKDLFMIQDYNNGEGCILSYTNTSNSLKKLSANEIKPAFNRAGGWNLAEWYKMNNFCAKGQFQTVQNQMIAKVPDSNNPNNNQKALTFLPDKVRMSMRSVDMFREIYGEPFFSAQHGSGEPRMNYSWPNLLLSKQLSFVKLADYDQINFNLKATLRNADIKVNDTPGNPPSIAKNSYDPKIHATQFRLAVPLQWRGNSCATLRTGDCQYHGDYIHLMFTFFDERYPGFKDAGISFIDTGTNQWMYNIDLRELIPNGLQLTKNPFSNLNQTAELKFDAKALMKKIILELEQKAIGEGQPGKYLPPRLVINGIVESDAEYLSHFGFGSFNLGYEVPGLSAITFDIEEFTITGKK